MVSRGFSVIEHNVQITHEWITELTERLDWTSQSDALRLLRVTLCVVRDHLGVNETAHLAAQLPLLIRGMFYEGWVPSEVPVHNRHISDFVHGIEERAGSLLEYRGEQDIQTVLKLLNARITEGEIADVLATLPRAIRDFWPT
jgi:uncharacterized protein (DUF2267 family)